MSSRRRVPGLPSTLLLALVAVVGGLGSLAWLVLSGGEEAHALARNDPAGDPAAQSAAAAAAAKGEPKADGGVERASEDVAPPPPEPAEEGANAGATLTVFGRVVDDRRFPIARAQVTLWLPDRPAVDVRTSADGKFELVTAEPADGQNLAGGLHARDEHGHAALATLWIWRNRNFDENADDAASGDVHRQDAGTIVLGPAGSVSADVRDDKEALADVPLVMEIGEERRLALTAKTDAKGHAEFAAVPAGDFVVHAELPGHGCARATARVDADGRTSVELRLQIVPPVEVTVKEKQSGNPVADAQVLLSEMVAANWGDGSYKERGNMSRAHWRQFPKTDAAGIARLEDVELEGQYIVNVQPPPGLQPCWDNQFQSQSDLRRGRKLTLWLVKPEAKTFRFPIEPGSGTAPAEGETVALKNVMRDWNGTALGTREAKVDHAALVVESPFPWGFYAWAVAADGSLAELRTQDGPDGAAIGMPAHFETPRRVDVTVKDPQEQPCAQHRISLRFNAKDSDNQREFTHRADAEGHAGFDGLLPGRADLHAALERDGWPDFALGVLDLTKGDGHLEVTLPTVREVLLRVRVDGEPRLPAKFNVYSDKLLRSRTVEDPAKGELHLFALEDASHSLRTFNFNADGFPPQVVNVPPANAGEVTEVLVELTTGGTLVVRVVATPNNYPRLQIERWDPAQETFGDFPGMPGWINQPNGPDGSYIFTALAPGSYRAADRRLSVKSEPVEVFGGGRTSEVELDLKHVVTVTGKLIVPEGVPAYFGRILVVDGIAPVEPFVKSGNVQTPGINVGRDGSFRLVLPLKRATLIRAWHPWLQPAAAGGEFLVEDSATNVELKLEETAVTTFAPEGETQYGDGTMFRVWLSDVARRDQVAAARIAYVNKGVARFGQTPDGVFDVMIDSGRSAPVLLRNVVLDPAGSDLGRLRFPRGCELRIELDVPDGVEKPKVSGWARRIGTINYGRGVQEQSSSPVIRNLGAGRFDVSIYRESGELGWRGELDLDGVNDLTIHVPMR